MRRASGRLTVAEAEEDLPILQARLGPGWDCSVVRNNYSYKTEATRELGSILGVRVTLYLRLSDDGTYAAWFHGHSAVMDQVGHKRYDADPVVVATAAMARLDDLLAQWSTFAAARRGMGDLTPKPAAHIGEIRHEIDPEHGPTDYLCTLVDPTAEPHREVRYVMHSDRIGGDGTCTADFWATLLPGPAPKG